MIRPKNNRTLLVIIAALLAVNIAGVILFFAKTPNGKKMNFTEQRKNAMQNYLKNDCGFSAEQLVQYDSLSERHKRSMQPLFEQLRKEKEQRIQHLAQQQFADTAIRIAVNNTLVKQEEVETKMLAHLRDVRNLCDAEQLVKFDASLHKMFARRDKPKKN